MIVALLVSFAISFFFLMIAMTVHEFAHGWVAYKRGDPTAKSLGRLTLNPLAHIDPVGTVLLPLILFVTTQGRFVFGAAKPVPINFLALKSPKRDMILIAISGPLSNLILAVLVSAAWRFLPASALGDFFFGNLITINVLLGIFNLLPIPPLDGSRVLMGLLPERAAFRYAAIEPYGFIIIALLLSMHAFDLLIEPTVSRILSALVVRAI